MIIKNKKNGLEYKRVGKSYFEGNCSIDKALTGERTVNLLSGCWNF